MEEGLVLALDCDGCIFDIVGLVEDFIAKINYCCGNEFKTKIMDRAFYNGERELFDKYSKIHQITKDEVLEEVFDLYRDRIDYKALYQLNCVFKGVIEFLTFLYKRGIFKKMYLVSHVNSQREIEAKADFFSKYLPFMELVFIPFHDKPYNYDKDHYFENADRKRTNKAKYFFKITGEDPQKTIAIDDSSNICDEFTLCGAKKAFHRDRECDDPLFVYRQMYNFLMGNTIDEDKANRLVKMFLN